MGFITAPDASEQRPEAAGLGVRNIHAPEKSQDRIGATIICMILLALWLGFLVHRSPLFAGSPTS